MIIKDKNGNVFNDGSLITETKIDFKPMETTAKKTRKPRETKATEKKTETKTTTTRKPRTPKTTEKPVEVIEVKSVEVVPPEPTTQKRRGRKPNVETGGKMAKVTTLTTALSSSKTQPGIIVETQDGDKVTLSQGTVDKLTGIVESIVTRLLGV